MMPSWCQCVTSSHPSKSSTPVRPPIPRTDTPLQSISGCKAACTCFKQTLHFVLGLSCALWETDLTVAAVLLGCISPPLLYILCMSQWNPTPSVSGRDGARPLPRNEHLSMGRVHTQLKCDAPQGRKVDGWMDGRRRDLDSHLRRLEGRH